MRGVTIPVSARGSRARVPRSQRAAGRPRTWRSRRDGALLRDSLPRARAGPRLSPRRRSRPACRSSCWATSWRRSCSRARIRSAGGEDIRPAVSGHRYCREAGQFVRAVARQIRGGARDGPLKRYINQPRVVDALAMKAHSQLEMREAMSQAEAVMRSRRHLRPREPNDFALETADEVLDSGPRSAGCVRRAPGPGGDLAGRGRHRDHEHHADGGRGAHREIGIRKSLGARRRDILRQFLVEP